MVYLCRKLCICQDAFTGTCVLMLNIYCMNLTARCYDEVKCAALPARMVEMTVLFVLQVYAG